MIKIFDTTLRDGEQSPGCSMSFDEKIEVAKQLEKLKVDVIEAGFAAASIGDFNSIREIANQVRNCTVASLARALPADIERAYEAVKVAANPRIHTFIATSDLHMKYKLKMSREAVIQHTQSMVKYAKQFCNDIEFSAEDASRSDPMFLYRVIEEAIKMGATTINIPDTVGYTTPDEFYELISNIRYYVKNADAVTLSVHCHNDLGLAVANSLAAVRAGATQVECTINGIGERAGNAALEEIVMAINTRSGHYNQMTNIDTKEIIKTSHLVSKVTGTRVQHNKAIVGENAFAHESGIHQHGMLANPMTYEIMTPESIGLTTNSLVLGKHSGKHALEDRIKSLGYQLTDAKLNEVFNGFKALADKKKTIYERDIEALIQAKSAFDETAYTLASFVINSGNIITSTCQIGLKREGQIYDSVAHGHGPVDAAFKAIEKIIGTSYELDDYTIQSVTEGEDAQGEAMVKIKVNNETYTGYGLSTDIIEASIKAYLSAINKIIQNSDVEESERKWA